MQRLFFVLALGLSGLTFAATRPTCAASDPCCQGCGCGHGVVKYCRVICEIQEVNEPKYSIACEDFCIPGKSKKCGCRWIPGCASIHTRRKLVVTTQVKQQPSWKWVVEYRCPRCAGCRAGDETPTDLPPPAKPAALEGLPELRPVCYPANQPAS